MNEASKSLLTNAVKEWTKFTNERERMRGIATEVASVAQKVVLEALTFMKAQNIDVECADVASMKMMGHPVVIEPVVEAQFPNVKTKVNMTCSGATRAIVINPNASISAGGNPFMFDQLKKGIPESFVTNAAEFVSDAFLFIARNMTPEEQAASQRHSQQAAPPAQAPATPSAPQPAAAAPPPRPAAPPQAAPPQQKPQQPVPQQPRPPQPPGQQPPRPAKPGQPTKPPGAR